VRVRAAAYQETVWDEVLPGRTVETLEVLQQALAAAERLLSLEGDTPEAQAKRARTAWRLDSAWGSEEDFNRLLGRGLPGHGQVPLHRARQEAGRAHRQLVDHVALHVAETGDVAEDLGHGQHHRLPISAAIVGQINLEG